jgi:predicted transposase YbfD/YdcC
VHIATSLPAHLADPERLAGITRSHWRIESLHWSRDVTFGEDKHTARTGHGPRNLACLRNTAITRHHRTGTINLAKMLRAAKRHPERALTAIAK